MTGIILSLSLMSFQGCDQLSFKNRKMDFTPPLCREDQCYQISRSEKHACGLKKKDDTLVCWGKDDYQQVTDLPDGEFARVCVHDSYSCAEEKETKEKECWGKKLASDEELFERCLGYQKEK